MISLQFPNYYGFFYLNKKHSVWVLCIVQIMRIHSPPAEISQERKCIDKSQKFRCCLSTKINSENSYLKLYMILCPAGLGLCTYHKQSDPDLTGLHVVDMVLFFTILTAEGITSYATRN